jgi:PEGA domain
MSRGRGSYVIPVMVILALFIIVLPVSGYTVAMYGTNAGFYPDLHAGSVEVIRSVPGSAGSDLDANVDVFTQDSVDVIILGGQDTFSPSTAAKIEAAVAGGKILVVAYPSNHVFDKSLPASNGGTTPGGQYLEVSDPNAAVTKAVFNLLPTRFDLQGTPPDKEQIVENQGSVPVLNWDTGMPALLYGKYGKGYVIEWTTIPVPSYMDAATADLILHRMILGLLPAPTTTTVVTTGTTVPATLTVTPVGTKTTVIPTTLPTVSQTYPVSPDAGSVMVYSSPTGANILIDGQYVGTTPGNINGVPGGNHILRLTLSGYYDYEGSIYVVPGQTTRGYGTLQPMNLVTTGAPTPLPTVIIPVIVPVATTAEPVQEKGLLENSSIIVAIIGVITAIIAAGASIFTHVKPPKKE